MSCSVSCLVYVWLHVGKFSYYILGIKLDGKWDGKVGKRGKGDMIFYGMGGDGEGRKSRRGGEEGEKK